MKKHQSKFSYFVPRKDNLGFSLIELLVAISITLIVFALMLTGLSKWGNRADRIHCISNIRGSGATVLTMISSGGSHWKTFAEGTPEHHQWARRADTDGILPDRKIARCPIADTRFSLTQNSWAWATYGINVSDLEAGEIVREINSSNQVSSSYIFYPSRVIDPSRHVLLADSATNTAGAPSLTFRIYHREVYASGVYPWHEGKAIIYFLDGHVEALCADNLHKLGVPYHDEFGTFHVPN